MGHQGPESPTTARSVEREASTPPVIPALRPTEIREGGQDKKGNAVPKVIFPGNEEAVKAATELAGPWQKKNDAVLDEIIAVIPVALLHLVRRCTSARNMWESLRSSLQRAGTTRVIATHANIMHYHCTGDMNVSDW